MKIPSANVYDGKGNVHGKFPSDASPYRAVQIVGAGEERARRLLDGETGPYTVERRFVRKDGCRVWVSLVVSLIRKSSGEPDHLVCVVEDVTARKIGELGLTARETEILREIVSERTNPEIANRLPYSVGTVKLCVRQIIAELGVRDRAEAPSRAVEVGLFPPARDRA